MVGLVVVSHSEALAGGVVALAREMSGPELAIEPAGGIADSDPAHPVLGTDAERVRAAIQRASSPDGVLVLTDLGSALMSAELAVELLDGAVGQIRLSAAPLVEGAVAAAVAAAGGAPLDEVEAQAVAALGAKAGTLPAPDQPPGPPEASAPEASAPGASAPEAVAPDACAQVPVRSAIGLHARPAARIVAAARALDADVRVGVLGGRPPVSAASLTELLALGARRGDTLVVEASGPQAAEAVRALEELAADRFGDGAAQPEPGSESEPTPAPAAAPTPAPAASSAPAPPSPGTILAGVPASGGVAAGPARMLA
ncbi:MAG: dihydroxyacetone kinase phosphoryl donor subunit DhaM, partial [Solirubrobacteraceae bacterium]